MVNTRAKIKKTQNILNTYFSQTSMVDFVQQSTLSGALIGSNDDLLTEILLRLPATSILRFKSVSKHWRCLLSHRCFTFRFDSLLKSPGLFTCNVYVPFDVGNRSTRPFRRLDFCYDPHGIKIFQSCNGLLMCCSHRGNIGDRKYYVFNPTTRQFAIIPSVPGGLTARKTIMFMCLAFHQTDCARYKVVCMLHRPDGACQIQIYSSETRKWKISIESFPMSKHLFINGVYWNGAIHFYPCLPNLVYFKLETEQLQMVPLTEQMVSSRDYHHGLIPFYFGESRGHLHLVVGPHGNNYLHLNVYEMLSDHSGWFVKYQVELDELPGAFPEMIYGSGYKFVVSDVVIGEKEEDTFMVVSIPRKLIMYNVHNKSFKQIFSFPHNGYIGYVQAQRYIETLASF